jgi:hypothetical protein
VSKERTKQEIQKNAKKAFDGLENLGISKNKKEHHREFERNLIRREV